MVVRARPNNRMHLNEAGASDGASQVFRVFTFAPHLWGVQAHT
jgi:hypothetical protein